MPTLAGHHRHVPSSVFFSTLKENHSGRRDCLAGTESAQSDRRPTVLVAWNCKFLFGDESLEVGIALQASEVLRLFVVEGVFQGNCRAFAHYLDQRGNC